LKASKMIIIIKVAKVKLKMLTIDFTDMHKPLRINLEINYY